MNKILFILTFVFFYYNVFSQSKKDKDWGIGVRLGAPTAVSVKKYFANETAIELDAGTSWATGISLRLHYLFHKNLPQITKGLDWYFGIGGQIRKSFINIVEIGIDPVIGIEYIFKDAPISIFMDGNLYVELVPAPFFIGGQGGLGVRYNF